MVGLASQRHCLQRGQVRAGAIRFRLRPQPVWQRRVCLHHDGPVCNACARTRPDADHLGQNDVPAVGNVLATGTADADRAGQRRDVQRLSGADAGAGARLGHVQHAAGHRRYGQRSGFRPGTVERGGRRRWRGLHPGH